MTPGTAILLGLGAVYVLSRGGGKPPARQGVTPGQVPLSDRLRSAGEDVAVNTIKLGASALTDLFAPSRPDQPSTGLFEV